MSSKTTDYREKVQQLRSKLEEIEAIQNTETSCVSMAVVAAVATPILAFLVLFFVTPSFVKRKEGAKTVRCLKRVSIYTALTTLIIWGGLYLFRYCQGWNSSLLCSIA